MQKPLRKNLLFPITWYFFYIEFVLIRENGLKYLTISVQNKGSPNITRLKSSCSAVILILVCKTKLASQSLGSLKEQS